jgi:hypothetical protein
MFPAPGCPSVRRPSAAAIFIALALAGVVAARPATAQSAPAGELSTLAVPAGEWAFAELGVPAAVEWASVLRLLVQRRYDAAASVRLEEATLARVQTQLDLAVRVEQAARIAAPGGVLSLAAVKTRQSRDRLREAVEALGGRLRERRGQYSIELDDGRRGRDLHAALKTLGLDVAAAAARLNAGESVPLEVPAVELPLALAPATWTRVVFEREIPARALFAELFRDPNALLLWQGAMALDASTRRFLESSPELVRTLHREAAPLFAAYGAQVAVRAGRVQVAGDPQVAALWEALVDEPVAAPAAFVRRLFTRDGGRLAVFFDLVQSLPDPQRRFATGAWIRDASRRVERFRALYEAVARADADWTPAIAPLKRYPADPWLLLRGLATSAEAAGNGLAGPQQRRFWERAFAAGIPDEPARALRDLDDEGLVDAAWLVDRVCNDARDERPTRFRQVLVLPRAMPAVATGDLPGALLAARGLAEFPALLLVLERGGLLSPGLATQAVHQASALQRIEDRNRRAVALAALQGGVALIDRLQRAGVLGEEAAAALLSALMSVPLGPDGFGAGVAGWLVDRVVPRLPRVADGLDLALADAMATRAGSRSRVTWEGADYAVDWTAAERDRLSRLRAAQGGVSLELLARVLQVMRKVAQGTPSPEKARDEMRDIAEVERALGRPRTLEEISEPLELTRVLPQARRELERVRGARDRDRVGRAAARLAEVVEWVAMHLLLSLAYTPHLGDPDGAAARAGDLALRHRFGVHEVSENARRVTPWSLPAEADDTGAVVGAAVGLEHALARLSLRRLSSAAPPRPTLLTAANLQALALQAALASPRDATGPELRDVVAALTRGRERVQSARGNPVALDALAEAGRLSGDRRAVLSWMTAHEPARVADLFTLAELVRIGEPTAVLPAAFGTPTLPLDGRLRLEWRGSEPWEPYSGRPGLGLLAALTADLPLRIAELTVQAGLPPEVYPGVLAFAVQDLLDSAELASSEDWAGLGRQARRLTRERFEDYVSALAGIGVLTPAEAARR